MSDAEPVTEAQAQPDTLQRPSQVAERLGISTAMLRRHVASYESVFGKLLTSKRDGRFYTQEVVERLESALALYRAQRVPSVEEGFRRLATGAESATEALEIARAADPMTQLIEELRLLREATERQNELLQAQAERLTALEVENRAIREALPPSQPSTPEVEAALPRRPWWRVWGRK